MLVLLLLATSALASLEPQDSPYNHPEITSYDVPIAYVPPEQSRRHDLNRKVDASNEIPQPSTFLELPKEAPYDPNAAVTTYFFNPDGQGKRHDGLRPTSVEVIKVPMTETSTYYIPNVQLALEPDRPYRPYPIDALRYPSEKDIFPNENDGYAPKPGYPTHPEQHPVKSGGYPSEKDIFPNENDGYAPKPGYPTHPEQHPVKSGGYQSEKDIYPNENDGYAPKPGYPTHAEQHPTKSEGYPTNAGRFPTKNVYSNEGYHYNKKSSSFDSHHSEEHSSGKQANGQYAYQHKNSRKQSSFNYNYSSIFKNSPFFAQLASFFPRDHQTFNPEDSTADDRFLTLTVPKDEKRSFNDWFYKY